MCAAYPKVKPTVHQQARDGDPDAIKGGTWEAFERILKRHDYFSTGLRKSEAARAVGAHFEPSRNRSGSFTNFHDAITGTAA